MSSRGGSSDGPKPGQERAARLEAALRANLKRRKDQARTRGGTQSQGNQEPPIRVERDK